MDDLLAAADRRGYFRAQLLDIRIPLAWKPQAHSARNDDPAASAVAGNKRHVHIHHLAHERNRFRAGARSRRMVLCDADRNLIHLWMDVGAGAQALNERSLRNYLTTACRADRAGNPA